MTRAEFIDTLRSRLTGEVSAIEIENTVRYYEEYIEGSMKNGKTEAAVLDELGSPLLIARTIMDTAARSPKGEESAFNHAAGRNAEGGQQAVFQQFQMNTWKAKLILVAVIVIIFALALSVLRILLPFLIPLLVIWAVFRMIGRGGKR